MKTLNNSISDNSLEILKTLVDEKLISYLHESYNVRTQPSNDFFMRLGLVCTNGYFILDNRVDWEEDWFCSPDYTPHMVFNKVLSEQEFSTYGGFSLREFDKYKINEKIIDIVLVQDEVIVPKDNIPFETIISTEGVIFVTNNRQYAFYKENTWLNEFILEYKGHNVLSKLQGVKTHWNVFVKPYDGEITRKLIHLKTNEEKVIENIKITGEICKD